MDTFVGIAVLVGIVWTIRWFRDGGRADSGASTPSPAETDADPIGWYAFGYQRGHRAAHRDDRHDDAHADWDPYDHDDLDE